MGGLIDPSIELVVSVMAVTTMAIARMIAAMRRRFFPPAHAPQTYVITWQSLGLHLGLYLITWQSLGLPPAPRSSRLRRPRPRFFGAARRHLIRWNTAALAGSRAGRAWFGHFSRAWLRLLRNLTRRPGDDHAFLASGLP